MKKHVAVKDLLRKSRRGESAEKQAVVEERKGRNGILDKRHIRGATSNK